MSNKSEKMNVSNYSDKELFVIFENYEILYSLLDQSINLYTSNSNMWTKAIEHIDVNELPYPEYLNDVKKAFRKILEIRDGIPHVEKL